MSKITNLNDYRTTTKYSRAVKRQRHASFLRKYNKFLSRAGLFFDKTKSKKGKHMVEEANNDD